MRIKEDAEDWLPEDINAIPLLVWNSTDNQFLVYQGADHGATEDLLLLSDAGSPA